MRIASPKKWHDLHNWVKITISYDRANVEFDEITTWANDNGTEKLYRCVWNEYYFEDEQDAVLFALRWS